MAVGRRGSLWLLKRRLTGRRPSIDASGITLRSRPDRPTRKLAASSGAVPGGGRRWASALHAGERYEKSRNKTNVEQPQNGVEGPQPPRVFGFFLRVKKETAPSRAVATTDNKKNIKRNKNMPCASTRPSAPQSRKENPNAAAAHTQSPLPNKEKSKVQQPHTRKAHSPKNKGPAPARPKSHPSQLFPITIRTNSNKIYHKKRKKA